MGERIINMVDTETFDVGKAFEFTPGVVPPEGEHPEALGFAFQKGKLVLVGEGAQQQVPRLAQLETSAIKYHKRHFLGYIRSNTSQLPCYALALVDDEPFEPQDPDLVLCEFRGAALRLGEPLFMLAGRALQVLKWDVDHQFCGRCGSPTEDHPSDRAKLCKSCGHSCYPRISPCMITLVTRGNEVLLGRAPSWPQGLYSTLAGFSEPGETIEQCVHREVYEEVGLQVHNLVYHSSQPWPFPHSLMLGFHAEYLSGDIVVDGVELGDAQWFPVDKLPMIPPPGSISRALIDAYVKQC